MKSFIRHTLLTFSLSLMGSSAALAMSNPASEFCVKLGGESLIVKQAPDGAEGGICKFKNGNIFEEWTLYRMFN
jgi:putative hemolysin